MTATVALPPAPTELPSPPSDGEAAAFEPPPLVVLPGDDLTRFILQNPPPSGSVGSSPRKKKKKKKASSSVLDSGRDDGDDEDAARLPPKIGAGLICIREAPRGGATNTSDGIDSSAPPPPPVRVKAIVAGRLLYRPSSRTWYVASNPRRYHLSQSPVSSTSLAKVSQGISANMGVGDRVIGVIEDQKASADYYRVNIFGSHPALLHVLSFEGATKRNRPQLDPGCLVYCHVVKGFGGGRMDPEVSCKVGGSGNSSNGKSTYNEADDDDGGAARKDWMTNEGTYGPLTGGTSFRISLGLARELLLPNNAALSALDKSGIPFELAVGVNGMAWVNSPAPEITIMILNVMKNSEVMDEGQVRGMVKVMVKNVKKELED